MNPQLELPLGGKRTILFVHGMMHGSWCWSAPWLAHFERRGWATEAVNLPGHGEPSPTGSNRRWATLNEYADALVERVAKCPTRPVLVGHSLGALLIQMRLKELAPPAAVLLAPTHPSAVRRAAWQILLQDPQRWLQMQWRGQPRLAIQDEEQCRAWFFSDLTPEDVVGGCLSRLEEESPWVCLELFFRPWVIRRTESTTPVLVLGAAQDRSVPCPLVKRVAALHGVEAEFFAGMGHDVMLEPGWTRVAERITEWLGELGLETSPDFPRPKRAASPELTAALGV